MGHRSRSPDPRLDMYPCDIRRYKTVQGNSSLYYLPICVPTGLPGGWLFCPEQGHLRH